MDTEEGISVLTGTIGDDIHSLGIKVIEHALTDAGFRVVPLGVQTSQEEFVEVAVETNARAILISSMSGHARLLCSGLRDKCIEMGLRDIILYLGGKLSTGDASWDELERIFLNMGYTRVYPSTTMPGQVIIDLKEDLATKD